MVSKKGKIIYSVENITAWTFYIILALFAIIAWPTWQPFSPAASRHLLNLKIFNAIFISLPLASLIVLTIKKKYKLSLLFSFIFLVLYFILFIWMYFP